MITARAAGGGQEIPVIASDDYRVVSSVLTRFVKGFGLSTHDAEEVVAEALTEVVARPIDGTSGRVRQPGAYLFWTTRNRALDRLRRARLYRAEPLEGINLDRVGSRPYSDEDDALAQALEKRATAETVESALRAAAAADDMVVVRVVTVWLDLAEELGREPTSREVAPEAGTSHTTVNNALRRFRAYLPPDA